MQNGTKKSRLHVILPVNAGISTGSMTALTAMVAVAGLSG